MTWEVSCPARSSLPIRPLCSSASASTRLGQPEVADCSMAVRSSVLHRGNGVTCTDDADQEAVLFQPPSPQDYRHVEQASRERYERLQGEADRRTQLGKPRKPRLRTRIRHWYRRLTGTTEAIGSHAQDDASDL